MNEKLINLEYYKKFPITLRDALINGRVMFPDSLQQEYETLHVFRGVKYNDKKKTIDKSDFLSHIERKKSNPMIVADEKKDIEL